MQEPIKVQGNWIGYLELGVFHQKVSARSTHNNTNSKGMDIEEVHRSLNGRCDWWMLTFPDKEQIRIPFSQVSVVGEVITHPKGVGTQYMVNYRHFDDARPKLQASMDIPKANLCLCGSDEGWLREPSEAGGPGGWVCSRCHPKPEEVK